MSRRNPFAFHVNYEKEIAWEDAAIARLDLTLTATATAESFLADFEADQPAAAKPCNGERDGWDWIGGLDLSHAAALSARFAKRLGLTPEEQKTLAWMYHSQFQECPIVEAYAAELSPADYATRYAAAMAICTGLERFEEGLTLERDLKSARSHAKRTRARYRRKLKGGSS